MRRITLCIGAAAFALSCGAAYAGSGNTIEIIQTNTLGIGNSLTADQSGATGSSIGGTALSGSNPLIISDHVSGPAVQTGGGNTADLTISDSGAALGGRIGLTQDNSSASSLASGNNAIISVLGDGLGLVRQAGGGNTANLSVTGLGATGSIYQNGNNNQVGTLSHPGLLVSGSGASGSITQNGDGNNIGLEVTGAGTTVSYTLNGSNVTAPVQIGTTNPTSGVQVISNGATVTITQTALP
jgi:hypothetical protein